MALKKVLIFGNYGGQNIGDEAILSGLLLAIPSTRFSVTVVSSDPAYSQEKHGVSAIVPPPFGFRSFLRLTWLKTIKVIFQTDYIIFGGGGLLQDKEKKAIYLWSYYIRLCKLFGKKIIFVANSVGPLSSPRSKKLAIKSLAGAQFISVRDQASKKLLLSLNKKLDVFVATDLTFFSKKIAKQKKQWNILFIGREKSLFTKQKTLELYKKLPGKNLLTISDQIDKKWLDNLELKTDIFYSNDSKEFRQKIAASQIVITSRLHGAIFAIQEGIPFLATPEAPKIKDFLTERGLGELLLPQKISVKKLLEKINWLKKNKNRWEKKLKKVYDEERVKIKNILPLYFS